MADRSVRSVVSAMVFLGAVATVGVAPPAAAQDADIIIGAGASSKDHFNVGRALCRQVQRAVGGVTCQALAIEGRDAAEPIAVMSDLRNAALELGIVPSD